MITLFILSSREVWINTMFFAEDANDKELVNFFSFLIKELFAFFIYILFRDHLLKTILVFNTFLWHLF
jgi:hypothetical protein